MIRTISEQEKYCASFDAPFVGMLCTTGKDWTWKIVATFNTVQEAESWFNAQPNAARVFRKGKLCLSKLDCLVDSIIARLITTFGRDVTRLKRSYYWVHTDSDRISIAENMRGELDTNGYDLDLRPEGIRITRRKSVFGYLSDGKLSRNLFKERRTLEEYLAATRFQVEIVELPLR